MVPEIQELYSNVKQCIWALKLESLSFVVASDLKMANIVAGIQSHGALHPCCYYEARSGDWVPAPLRTLGSIGQNYMSWRTAGQKIADGKLYKNCTNHPRLNGSK